MNKDAGKRRLGSCLCGRAKFSVAGEVQAVGQCLCSQCRKVSGTNGNAVFLVPNSHFSWLGGEPEVVKFSLPSGWSVVRCAGCGSPLPQSHDGEQMWIAAGLMDDDLDAATAYRIFVGSRADWDREADSVAEFDEFPPS